MLPFYKVPIDKETGKRPTWNNSPHLNQLRNEIFYCTVPMFTLPFVAFYAVQSMDWVVEKYGQGKADALAAVAAVATTQIIIFIIVVVKYWEDFMVVVRGEGHLPYDHALKEQSEYF